MKTIFAAAFAVAAIIASSSTASARCILKAPIFGGCMESDDPMGDAMGCDKPIAQLSMSEIRTCASWEHFTVRGQYLRLAIVRSRNTTHRNRRQ
jgi:hypothetical protein